VGAIVIPVLMAAGVHPAAAAGAVLAGTFGHTLSPAGVHNVMIASLGKITPFEVVAVHARATITAGIVAAFVFYLTTRLRKEDKNCRANGQPVPSDAPGQPFKVNPLKALVPILPLVLVVLASPQVGIIKLGKEANTTVVTTSMIIGALACWAVSDMKAGGVSKSFFKGLGDGYGGIVGIIIAAAAFTGGMTAIGLTDALINVMKSSQSMVKLASVYGPFLIAVLSGSGDAATIAFNQAVTPSAAHFGKTIAQLGAVAQVSGALGRTMSPVAGACIATAVVANVNPFEVAKRTAPAMIVASLIILTMLA
jgi:DcuC family C4-dicarboxylate transporter